MKFRTALFALLCATLLLPVAATAQQELPPTIKACLGLAPGCTVTDAMQMENVEVGLLDCGTQSSGAVAAFYKDQMTKSGFSIKYDSKYAGGAVIVSKLGESTASADVSQEQGKTKVNLTLDNVDTLAGAQTGTQAGAAMPKDTAGAAEPDAAQAAESDAAQAAEPGAVTTESVETEGKGMADEIWGYVSPRQGDVVLEETVINNCPMAVLTSQSTPTEIMNDYSKILQSDGWMQAAYLAKPDGGLLSMFKDGVHLQIVCDVRENGDASGTRYTIMLPKAN